MEQCIGMTEPFSPFQTKWTAQTELLHLLSIKTVISLCLMLTEHAVSWFLRLPKHIKKNDAEAGKQTKRHREGLRLCIMLCRSAFSSINFTLEALCVIKYIFSQFCYIYSMAEICNVSSFKNAPNKLTHAQNLWGIQKTSIKLNHALEIIYIYIAKFRSKITLSEQNKLLFATKAIHKKKSNLTCKLLLQTCYLITLWNKWVVPISQLPIIFLSLVYFPTTFNRRTIWEPWSGGTRRWDKRPLVVVCW